jgi:Carboxypeptidase regulatory-like domain
MPNLTITVFLSPNQKFTGKPDPAWLKPQGVKLKLTPVGGTTGINLDATDSAGTTTSGRPKASTDYDVTAVGTDFKDWTVADQVSVGTDDTAADVVLVPNGNQWLLPLLLWRYDDTGKRIGIPGAEVELKDAGGKAKSFSSRADGSVYAISPAGRVQVELKEIGNYIPVQSGFVARTDQEQGPIAVEYEPKRARITVRPELVPGGRDRAIPGVTFELNRDGQEEPLRQVNQGSQACVFSDLEPGWVTVRIVAPARYNGSQVTLVDKTAEVPVGLAPGDDIDLSPYFLFEYLTGEIKGRVVDSDKNGLQGIKIVASSKGLVEDADSDADGRYTLSGLRVGTWTIMLDQSAVELKGQTLIAEPSEQVIKVAAGKTTKAKRFTLKSDEHGIKGHVRDSGGNPVPHAIVQIRDQRMKVIDTVVADEQGAYTWKSPSSGMFVVNLLKKDGETVQRQVVTVNSWTIQDLLSTDAISRLALNRPGANQPGSGVSAAGLTGPANGSAVREAFTDLAAYPVLTEEVSTTGVPAPVAGGTGGGGGGGAGYAQVVDQAMRDVLGWRPGGDLSGFQAALTGAFQLREVEGHTEWTWQQRGYAVQADMGALTGAQAAIYARAKSALDQILPLLAGLTPLNPALFPPQDLEAIRTVITAELQELVSELALQGGPRIQRVDQLFQLLTGERVGSKNLNPDVVQGNLGTLRDRFALTTDQIDTVDEERIVTNFRIVVEQVLSLQATWGNDRGLLAPLDPKASFGTILIWLSRSLEAVCESVGDLNFALDSVFVDAAQRQVLELKFPNEEALLLSDLLDWVDRASRDEGPRIIQDAGKDGVFAFAPVLRRLRDLIQKTLNAAQHDKRLPQGLRTPRVERALQVLVAQLDEATELASAVRRDAPPVIEAALVFTANKFTLSASRPGQQPPLPLPTLENLPGRPASIQVEILGANFRAGASAVLIAQDREDLPELHTWGIGVNPPNVILATFRNPRTVPDSGGVTWLVAVTNEDGTHSNQFPI